MNTTNNMRRTLDAAMSDDDVLFELKVEADEFDGKLWLTWKTEAMGGIALQWHQRQLTPIERLLWKLGRTPKP